MTYSGGRADYLGPLTNRSEDDYDMPVFFIPTKESEDYDPDYPYNGVEDAIFMVWAARRQLLIPALQKVYDKLLKPKDSHALSFKIAWNIADEEEIGITPDLFIDKVKYFICDYGNRFHWDYALFSDIYELLYPDLRNTSLIPDTQEEYERLFAFWDKRLAQYQEDYAATEQGIEKKRTEQKSPAPQPSAEELAYLSVEEYLGANGRFEYSDKWAAEVLKLGLEKYPLAKESDRFDKLIDLATGTNDIRAMKALFATLKNADRMGPMSGYIHNILLGSKVEVYYQALFESANEIIPEAPYEFVDYLDREMSEEEKATVFSIADEVLPKKYHKAILTVLTQYSEDGLEHPHDDFYQYLVDKVN